jgi:hypothetical protein
MSLFFRGAVTIASAALFCAGLGAQSTSATTPVTTVIGGGTNTSAAIAAFSTEVTIPIANIGVGGSSLGNIGSIPANILAGLTSGALEIRQIVQLRPDNRLSVRHILVAPGSPNPTPAAAQTMIIDEYFVDVDQVIRSSDPSTVTFIGNIDQIVNPGPFGHTRFRPFLYSAGFNSATPTALTGLSLVVPGGLTTFASSATGTVTLPGSGAGGSGGGGTGGNQPPVASAGPNISTVQTEVFLDASASTDPEKGALTYSWRVVSGSANILNPADVKPRVQLSGNFGSHVFEVTVKDPQGLTSTAQVTVTYVGRF